MKDRDASIGGPIGRACVYAITSLLAHVSGYLLQAEVRVGSDWILVFALWVTTLPFFLQYSISYSHAGLVDDEKRKARAWANENARPVVVAFAAIIAPALALVYRITNSSWPAFPFWLAMGIFACLFLSYGSFILRRRESGCELPVRHQLVWPVAFAIGLPLYSGAIFSTSRVDSALLWPVLLLLAFFLLTQRLSKLAFLLASAIVVIGVLALAALNPAGPLRSVGLLTFYLAIAAYLAVFEAWAMTSALIARSQMSGTSKQFYLAVLLSHSIAALVLPALFVLSNQGKIFFFGLLLHAASSISVWYWIGRDLARLASPLWLYAKTGVGLLFLGVLVADSWIRIVPTSRFLPNLVGSGILGLSLAFAVLAIGFRAHGDGGVGLNEWLHRLKVERRGVIVLTIVLAIVLSVITLGVEGYQGDQENLVVYKADMAFMSYVVIVAVCIVVIIVSAAPRGGAWILGVLLSMRLFTSSVVGLIVLVPCLEAGFSVPTAVLVMGLPFFLAASGGFLLNDAGDAERDRINKPHRAIPRGLITRRTALSVGWVLLGVALLLIVGVGGATFTSLLQMVAVVGVTIYNPVIARWGWVKGFLTAGISILPIVAALSVGSGSSSALLFTVASFLFLAARETLMDVLDADGDAQTGLRTLPVLLGAARAERLALALGGAAVMLLAIVGVGAVDPGTRMVVTAVSGALLLLGSAWTRQTHAPQRRRLLCWCWAPILLALLAWISTDRNSPKIQAHRRQCLTSSIEAALRSTREPVRAY